MHFSSIHILLLVPAIIILWCIFFREKAGYIHPNPLIKKHLKTPVGFFILWILRGLIVFFLIGTLAGPYSTGLEKVTKKESSHILILLDISRSMLAEDISPNRLSGAKKTIESFIGQRKGDMIGLIIFAGKPFLSLPFSSDYKGILSFFEQISPDLIHQEKEGLSGTAIGDAIVLANMTLSGVTGERAIILVTDGKANIGIDPRIALDESRKKNIPIYTIGIGGNSGSELYYTDQISRKRVYFYDEKGNILKNDIDETLMRDLAEETGGQYFRANNIADLSKHFDSINTITSAPPSIHIENRITRYEPIFFVLVLIFLGIETVYREYLWRKYRLR